MTDSRDLLGKAYHEAGHAVVAHLLGRALGRVSIDPEDMSGGADVSDPRTPTRKDWEHTFMIAGAGEIAQNLFHPDTFQEFEGERPSTNAKDLGKQLEAMKMLVPDDAGQLRLCEKLREKTANMLDEPKTRAAIEKLAGVLRQRLSLSGEEATALITEATRAD